MSLTAAQFADALRLPYEATVADQTVADREIERRLAVATALCDGFASGAPEDVSNEAALRLAGWLGVQQGGLEVAAEVRFIKAPVTARNALRLSGAAALLAPWRVHRAGVCE